ncbi:hypothetical protein B566_EDAN008267 [Ephemera danica]|nr:hypothetical protein B566_EDAN008267 [Ephemera danica]
MKCSYVMYVITLYTECSVNCHRKCEKHMPNLCGVNQKLLAEALCSVKKGRTNPGSTKKSAVAEGREGASPGAHPARRLSTSLSSDSESGEEGGGGSRRYTPPARTIPRFRKYTLLDKDSSRRLGTPDCPAGDVYLQPFFKSIDWPALDRKELEPPFKPRVE